MKRTTKMLPLALLSSFALAGMVVAGVMAPRFAQSIRGDENTARTLEISAEELEAATSGDGSFLAGKYDPWKVENVTFETIGGLRYAVFGATSSLYSTSPASTDSDSYLGYRGAGYYAVTITNKKATGESFVYLLNSGGEVVSGDDGYATIATGDAASDYIELPQTSYRRLKLGGAADTLRFTKITLHYNCEHAVHDYGTLVEEVAATCDGDGHLAYYYCEECDTYFTEEKVPTTWEALVLQGGHLYEDVHDGVYHWKECSRCHDASEKDFVVWEIGTPVDGIRVDTSSVGISRTVSIWDGSSRSTSLEGAGTAESPYLIQSAKDLAYFSDTVFGGNTYSGKVVKMTTSVDVNGNTLFLAGYQKSFAGTFDGGHNAILNDNITFTGTVDGNANAVGLFRTVGAGSVIRNLVLDGTVTAAGKNSAGAFVGMANPTTIENCYNFATVNSSSWYVGGFIGNALGAGSTIRNSANFGTVTSTFSASTEDIEVGGLIGRSANASTISDSANFGAVTGQGNVGGILGLGKVNLSNVQEFGFVTATGTKGLVGAIAGTDNGGTRSNVTEGDFASYKSGSRKNELTWKEGVASNGVRADMNQFGGARLVSVWNGSDVSTSLEGAGTAAQPYVISSAADFAYFAAQVNAGTTYADQYVEMNKSVDLDGHALTVGGWSNSFAGNFDAKGNYVLGMHLTSANAAHDGGTIGLFPTLANAASIKNLALDGSVEGTTMVGALVGQTNSKNVANVYNFATVTATGVNVGGIAGNTTHAGAVILNSTNFGAISSSSTDENLDCGGIVGRLIARVEGCENYGTVQAAKYVGGVVGQIVNGTVASSTNYAAMNAGTVGGVVGDGYGTITDCVNNGTITASGWAGGVIGTIRTGAITMSGCINNGDLTSTATYVGGVAGAAVTANKAHTLTNCVNNGKVTGTTLCGGVYGATPTWAKSITFTITGCSNTGAVKGNNTTNVGAIGGLVAGTYSGCTNTGTVNGATPASLFGSSSTITAA